MRFICYPTCSTCGKARKWLHEHNIPFTEENIKDHPPSAAELQAILQASGKDSRKLFNTSGQIYRELNLKDRLQDMSDAERLELLSQHGMLVKRPLLISDDESTALIGFKASEYETLLS